MITWEKRSLDNDSDWILVDSDIKNDENSGNDDKKIVASIVVSENFDKTCNIDAACKKMGYSCRFESMNIDRLKIVIPELRKNISRTIARLRIENQKPVDKKIYKMIDSIPIWMHIKDGAERTKIELESSDYGKLAEMLGSRVLLNNLLQRGGILEKIFSDVDILAIHLIKKFKILKKAKIGLGDIVLEVDYKKDNVYGKKIVVFEIKHGKFIIEQNQLRRYCSMVLNPGEYFHKADEVKVLYMIFDDIDTSNASAYYHIKELDQEFARKVLDNDPVGNEIYDP